MAYGDFKDLNRRATADKVLRDKAFNIMKNSKYDGYQRGLASVIYRFLDKKTYGSSIKNENISNKQLAEDFIFHRQYLGCRSSRYAIDKKV